MFDIENKKIVDLTRLLDPTSPNHARETQWNKPRGFIPPAVIPEEEVKVEPYIFVHDRCMCEWLTLWSHAGTHLETAIHQYVFQATDIPKKLNYDIADIPLEKLCGPGYALDLTFVCDERKETDMKVTEDRWERFSVSGPQILPSDIEEWEKRNNVHIEENDIVFLYTRNEVPNIPIVPEKTAKYLVRKRKIKMIGTNDETIVYGALGHEYFHNKKIPVVEMLTNLEKLGTQRAYIVALGLRIKGIGGSPGRIIAYVDKIIGEEEEKKE
ncbi:MAG: cyclase family protein [Candidatus Helarchaeota archaeon]